ncbi:MAG: ABC transporter permease [Gammaproteobacteria bacterium]|nr:ABC transporter permease [Gammaproteobacteria bacterium]
MEHVNQAIVQALTLLFSGDPELWTIIRISFGVSLQAILYATPLALLIAFLLAHGRFPGQQTLITIFHTLLAVPAVVVGLTLYIVLSHTGPLGSLDLLFTQTAMIVGQVLLSFPILVAMGHSALSASDTRAWETARSLGAPPWRSMLTVMYEVRFGLFAAVIAAFGRIIAEVGCSLMVGGNILNFTRNITTAIAMETTKGEFARGIALGIVLLVLALLLNFTLTAMRTRLDWVR